MGAPIASRIAAGGYAVLGYDSRPVVVAGVRVVPSLSSLREADVVFVIVPTDADVVAVVTSLIEAGRTGQVIVISSSVHPSTCRDLAGRAAVRGIDVLDAALTGGLRGARDGEINLLVGGSSAVVDQIAPVLATFCARYHVLGDVGAGQIAKSASNLIHWAEIVAVTESLRLSAALGVSPAALREALQWGGTDSRTLRELELMHFTWYAKDIAIAQRLAAEADVPLPVAALSLELMDDITPETVRRLLSREG
jgi:3-hydroxyisobutyrate dehydrogenase